MVVPISIPRSRNIFFSSYPTDIFCFYFSFIEFYSTTSAAIAISAAIQQHGKFYIIYLFAIFYLIYSYFVIYFLQQQQQHQQQINYGQQVGYVQQVGYGQQQPGYGDMVSTLTIYMVFNKFFNSYVFVVFSLI